jgi:hypothetical protein
MKTGTSNYTPKCLEYSKYFKGMQGITTHQSENIDYNDFSGTVYVNRYEFVCIDQMEESGYMVYINNPNGHDGEQWVFGYYKTFGRALKKAAAIVEKREYPKPIEIW